MSERLKGIEEIFSRFPNKEAVEEIRWQNNRIPPPALDIVTVRRHQLERRPVHEKHRGNNNK